MTLRGHPLTNQILLCILTNHKPPIENPQSKMIQDHPQSKENRILFNHVLLLMEDYFHLNPIGYYSSSQVHGIMEVSKNVSFFHHGPYLFFNSETLLFYLERIPAD